MRYWVENQADLRTSRVYVYGSLGHHHDGGLGADDLARDLRRCRGDRIELHVNSSGGGIEDALKMYELLRTFPDVVTYVDSEASSAASVLAMAGSLRYAHRDASMKVHECSSTEMSSEPSARKIQNAVLANFDAMIAAIYAERAGGTAQQWRDRMKAETVYTAEGAVRVGLVDQVLYRTPGELEVHAAFQIEQSARRMPSPRSSVAASAAKPTASRPMAAASPLRRVPSPWVAFQPGQRVERGWTA